jgi:hypothetical protein
VTRLEPRVDVCEKRYVFNAAAPGGNFTPVSFSPRGQCPVYEVPQEIAEAVNSKRRSDELQTAQLASRGVATAPIKSGRDGGMHPSFVEKLRPQQIVDDRGNIKLVVDKNNPSPVVAYSAAAAPEAEVTTAAVAVDVPTPRSAPQTKLGQRPAEEPSFGDRLAAFFRGGSSKPAEPQEQVASIQPAPKPKREGVKAKVSRMIGLRGSEEKPQADAQATAPRSAAPKVKTASASGEAQPAAPAPAAPAAAPASNAMSGSAPIPQSSNFDSRWSAFR